MNRAGRFRSLGDQVDFNGIFSKFAACDFAGSYSSGSARKTSARTAFIRKHIIRVTEKAFDDFAGGGDVSVALKTLGLK